LKLKNDFLLALLKEISLRKGYLQEEPVDTIYFGGGTPSLLDYQDLAAIITAVRLHFLIHPEAEWTFEANPDDISAVKLRDWKQQGINRLSIGVQSFFEEDLKWMNRAHNAQQALNCIVLAREQGFDNVSIDLIFGGPTLSDENWRENLRLATSLNIPHLSCYALTVEPGTALETLTKKKRMAAVSSDDQARQFLILTDVLESAGYQQYEISNFSLPGKRSRHNSAYWQAKKYLGLGPSAHSFNGYSRQWNVANNALYNQALLKNELPFEIETLTTTQQFNEYIMTSLRTIEGIDMNYVQEKFGAAFTGPLLKSAIPFIEEKWTTVEAGYIKLTREGKLFGDKVSSALFAVISSM